MRHFRVLACLLLPAVVYCADCHAGKKPDTPSYGGIYRAPLLNNPRSLDPAYAQDIYAIAVINQVFDGLVQYSPDLFVIPSLARNWQVEQSGKVYRFFLREDARFHDGSPVTAQDVVFSLGRLLRVSPSPTILPHLLKIVGAKAYSEHQTDVVAGLEAVDDSTVVVRLDEAYAPFLVALGIYQAKIVPVRAVEQDEKSFGRRPIGSGPFKFASWRENELIRLVGFEQYYAGKPFLDELDYVIYPGVNIEKVFSDFQSGKLEEMEVYGEFVQRLKGRKDLQWIRRPSLSLQFYGVNCQHPRLKDPELRKALSLAIDRQALIANVYDGLDEPAMGILPPGLPGYHPSERGNGYDMERAAEHLRHALPDGPDTAAIEIVSNSQSPYAQAELEFVRKCWEKLGIRLEVRYIPDWSAFKDYLKSDSLQLYRFLWFADIPDPDDVLRPLFASGAASNYTRYHSGEVDGMLQDALGLVDPLERANLYHQIEERIETSSPVIPVSHLSVNYVYQPAVRGAQVSALGAQSMSFHRVWLENLSPQ